MCYQGSSQRTAPSGEHRGRDLMNCSVAAAGALPRLRTRSSCSCSGPSWGSREPGSAPGNGSAVRREERSVFPLRSWRKDLADLGRRAAATSPALPNTNVAPFHTSRSVKSLASTAQKALGFNRCRMCAHHIRNKLHILRSKAVQTKHTFINFRKSAFLRLLRRKFLESQQRT